MDLAIIDQYEQGGQKLRDAVRGLLQTDMRWVPPPDADVGRWSIQQVVLHLMDSDLIWTARMKCIVAEDDPLIVGYDESKFAANLFYDQQDADGAIHIFDLNRRQFAGVLRILPDTAFARPGRHNERGAITLGQSVHWMVEHVEHHLGFIRRKRERIGKPLKD